MPGSIVQASPGGTSPRTIKYNQMLITNTFEAILPEEIEVGDQGEGEGAEGLQGLGGDQEQLPECQGQGLDGQEGRAAEGVDQEMGEVWVKGATRSDNDRYRSFLAYMEEKREEARLRLQRMRIGRMTPGGRRNHGTS